MVASHVLVFYEELQKQNIESIEMNTLTNSNNNFKGK